MWEDRKGNVRREFSSSERWGKANREETVPDSWLRLDLPFGSSDLVLHQVLLVIRPTVLPKGFDLTCYLGSWQPTLLLVEASPSGSGPIKPIFPKTGGFR